MNSLLRFIAIIISYFIILSIVVGLFIEFILLPAFDYPIFIEKINDKYYLTYQEYGEAMDVPGTNIYLYKTRDYWLDSKVGHIDLYNYVEDFNIVTKELNDATFRTVIKGKDKIILDTTLSFSKKFDFEVYP